MQLFGAGCCLLFQNAPPPALPQHELLPIVLEPPGPEAASPSKLVEYTARFTGVLCIYAEAPDLDLRLRVEPASHAWHVEDDDGGGGTRPSVVIDVEPGQTLAVTVSVADMLEAPRSIELHFLAAPEEVATRAAEGEARTALLEVKDLQGQGELELARGLLKEVLDGLLTVDPEARTLSVSGCALDIGNLAFSLGDDATAAAGWSRALLHLERARPADHPHALKAAWNLAAALRKLGRLPEARQLLEHVQVAYERDLREDDPLRLEARLNLALIARDMGDVRGALVLQQQALAEYLRTQPADHPGVLRAQGSLADTLTLLGDDRQALELLEHVLEAYQSLPEDDPDLLRARASLASTLRNLGELERARQLGENVLARYEHSLSAASTEVLNARIALASTMIELCEYSGARLLLESGLQASASFPEDHPLRIRMNASLALARRATGDPEGALVLLGRVVAALQRTSVEDDSDLLAAQNNLAVSLEASGDLAAARDLLTSVLAAREASHVDPLDAKQNLASVLYRMDDFSGARALEENVLQEIEGLLPDDHPYVLVARGNLLETLLALGDVAGAQRLLPALIAGMRARVLAALALSPREARDAVASESVRLDVVLRCSESGDAATRARVFELIETLRSVASQGTRAGAALAEDPALSALAQEAALVRSELNDLVASFAAQSIEESRTELGRLMLSRDRTERALRAGLQRRGVRAGAVEFQHLATVLPPRSAAVGFRRYRRVGADRQCVDAMLAHVLTPEGALVRVELGSVSAIEALVTEWRSSLGVAKDSRGIASTSRAEGSEAELARGNALRERLIDPILAFAGDEVSTLFLCPDDVVYLVPLEALPMGEARVGDRIRIVSQSSFTPLLDPCARPRAEPRLLALGAVEYGGLRDLAGREGMSFPALPGTGPEIEGLARLFQEAFGREAEFARGSAATKAALFEGVPGVRFVHFATHGWFAPTGLRAPLDQPSWRTAFDEGLAASVAGVAPMTLCGLALAGANQGRDALGRVPGILSAEELGALDLSQCELAALSACETNVGVRRAGQGIQSLQSALHAAGARTAITSLWKVDDEATRHLFELFYSGLWKDGLGKAEALWHAKRALQAEGHPLRDWAGWVLSGDPN